MPSAMMFVREAINIRARFSLIKDNVEANGKSIMSVLGLAIHLGIAPDRPRPWRGREGAVASSHPL
jgi:hypothetical protein